MYRLQDPAHNGSIRLEVFLAHPGGPYFTNKHAGYWGIPKGLLDPGEDERAAAIREFREETGFDAPLPLVDLGSERMKSGKVVHAFASRWDGHDDPPPVASNTCPVEWPPRSGTIIDVPEIDKGRFFPIVEARWLMNERQQVFLDRLRAHLDRNGVRHE